MLEIILKFLVGIVGMVLFGLWSQKIIKEC